MCNLSEGIYEKGEHEANVKTAQALIAMKKISLQEIAKATRLTLGEVEALANMQPA